MANLSAFVFTTLNGFMNDPAGDISWHRHGTEENKHAADSLEAENILLFGRKTYELMAGYWPTPMALENDPTVAKGMNSARKIVFSNTLKRADWQNTEVIGGDIVAEMKRIKASSNANMTLLGSGSILTLFAKHGLIDSYQIMIDPVAIGEGATVFQGIKNKLDLQLIDVKKLSSGVVLLNYKPF